MFVFLQCVPSVQTKINLCEDEKKNKINNIIQQNNTDHRYIDINNIKHIIK